MLQNRRDLVATALVATAVAWYLGYLILGAMPFAQDVRGMAAVGLILGFASRRIGGREGFEHQDRAMAAGLGCMALGIAALVTESEAVLALFIIAMVALWAAAAHVRAGTRHLVNLRHQY